MWQRVSVRYFLAVPPGTEPEPEPEPVHSSYKLLPPPPTRVCSAFGRESASLVSRLVTCCTAILLHLPAAAGLPRDHLPNRQRARRAPSWDCSPEGPSSKGSMWKCIPFRLAIVLLGPAAGGMLGDPAGEPRQAQQNYLRASALSRRSVQQEGCYGCW